jgi:epoxyqueuosine reductase
MVTRIVANCCTMVPSMTVMHLVHRVLGAHLDQSLYENGFAELKGLLVGRYAGYSYGISILRRLDARIVDGIEDGPTREYFDLYHSINSELNDIAGKIAAELSAQGIVCEAVMATARDEDLDEQSRETLSHLLSHKLVATRAGLGWIGKTDLLVSRRFGPRVRLASIVTTAPLEVGVPTVESECGRCRLCVEQCPAQAATGASWHAGGAREAFFDAFKCRDYCRKISMQRLGESISLCGKCVNVCPLGVDKGSVSNA